MLEHNEKRYRQGVMLKHNLPMTASPNDSRDPYPRRRWQFGIGALLLFTTLFGFFMGVYTGMIRPQPGETTESRIYLILAIAAPLGILVLVGIIRTLVLWREKWKNRDV
jgi:hypothetical protein